MHGNRSVSLPRPMLICSRRYNTQPLYADPMSTEPGTVNPSKWPPVCSTPLPDPVLALARSL
jgi:hypothetical protein